MAKSLSGSGEFCSAALKSGCRTGLQTRTNRIWRLGSRQYGRSRDRRYYLRMGSKAQSFADSHVQAGALALRAKTTGGFSSPVRAAFRVDALIGQPQAFDGTAAHQVLLYDLRGVRRLYMAIPDAFGIYHYGWAVFALIKAAGFIDAHDRAQPRGFRQLLQLSVEFAFSIAGAGWARGIGGTGVEANKDVTLKRGQAVFLLADDESPY